MHHIDGVLFQQWNKAGDIHKLLSIKKNNRDQQTG